MHGPLRIALTSLGCKVNFAEMAELAGQLAAAGCDIVPEAEPADVRVVNSCTVTLQADATTRQRLSRLRREDPEAHLVLTGCSVDTNGAFYAASSPSAPWADAIFSNQHKSELAEYILTFGRTSAPPKVAKMPRLRSRAFLKVQDGCDHRCTYCIVWKARGPSQSISANEVMNKVGSFLAAGYREIVLCGVDLGSYGRGTKVQLPALIRMILAEIGTQARLRLSSINANDVSAELISLNLESQLCPHWHMPLQSGSDPVLKAMHRGYRRRQYLRVVQELREADPRTEFTTDIMVAFPGEAETDHRSTIDLVHEVGFAQAHIFRYSTRPGTPAAALPLTDDFTARRRSAEIRQAVAQTAQAAQQRAVGKRWQAVWDGLKDGVMHGLTETYQEVWTESRPSLQVGGLDPVLLDTVTGNGLHATVCDL